jgi:hypothetical protein
VSVVNDVLSLLGEGFRPYTGAIESSVQEEINCCNWPERCWFVKDADKGRTFICLGCNSRPCTLQNPEGFELTAEAPLHVNARLQFMDVKAVTPEQLLNSKGWFRVDEAAFILNVSTRTVRKLVDEGVLVRHVKNPVRIAVDSLREEYERGDW